MDSPDWQRTTYPTFDALYTAKEAPLACSCGAALRRFTAEGAGGYVNGYTLWAVQRADVRAFFQATAPRHDVIERQWIPGDVEELLTRRHTGRCTRAASRTE